MTCRDTIATQTLISAFYSDPYLFMLNFILSLNESFIGLNSNNIFIYNTLMKDNILRYTRHFTDYMGWIK